MKHILIIVLLISSLFSNKIEDAYILVSQDNVDNNVVKKAYLMAKDDFKDDLYLIDKKYFYIVAAEYILRFKDCKSISTIDKFYNKIKDIDVIPISYLKARCLPVDKNNTTVKIKLYKQAIKEDNSYDFSYYRLAYLYLDQDEYDLAISTIKKGLKKSIASKSMRAEFHSLLSKIYFYKRIHIDSIDSCMAESKQGKELLKLSTSEAEKALMLDSTTLDAYDFLSSGYNLLGYEELALIANRGLKNSSDKFYKYLYESNLVLNGKKDTYLDMIKNNKDSNNSKLRAGAYTYNQDWSKALKYQKIVINDSNYFYDFLRYAVINYSLGKKEEAKKIMKNIPEKSLNNEWKKQLQANYLGKLSDQELLKKANNICKQTEANYYIGIKHITNNKAKAKEYFKKVLNLKAYGYVEYRASKYFLKEGIK